MPMYVWYLWIAPNVLCAVALIIGFRRKRLHALPWFFSSLGYFVLQAVAGVAVFHSGITYRWFVLFTELASSAFELAVIYELANKLILFHFSRTAVRLLSRWTLAALLLLATIAAALFYPHVQVGRVPMTLSLATNLVAVGLLLALLLVTRVVGVSWRRLPAGVAVGQGISATGELAGAALFGQPGRAILGDNIRLVSWHVCVLVWLFYLLLPEKPENVGEAALQISELSAYPQELHKMVRSWTP